MKQKLRNCNICDKEYEVGFFGAGKRYCSRVCASEARRQYHLRTYIPKERDCAICGRDIRSVGLKKQANKYCSNRCMFIAQHKRAGAKFINLRIPISEIPTLFS